MNVHLSAWGQRASGSACFNVVLRDTANKVITLIAQPVGDNDFGGVADRTILSYLPETKENIKTIEGQLQLWSKQAENWEGQRENVRKQIEEQVKQWTQENMFEGKKVSLEQTRTIADIILRSLESVQKIGQIIGTAAIK